LVDSTRTSARVPGSESASDPIKQSRASARGFQAGSNIPGSARRKQSRFPSFSTSIANSNATLRTTADVEFEPMVRSADGTYAAQSTCIPRRVMRREIRSKNRPEKEARDLPFGPIAGFGVGAV